MIPHHQMMAAHRLVDPNTALFSDGAYLDGYLPFTSSKVSSQGRRRLSTPPAWAPTPRTAQKGTKLSLAPYVLSAITGPWDLGLGSGNKMYSYRVDSWGPDGNCSRWEDEISDAINLILDEYYLFPLFCIPNQGLATGRDCVGLTFRCWDGHALEGAYGYPGDDSSTVPLVVLGTLMASKEEIDFKIDCQSWVGTPCSREFDPDLSPSDSNYVAYTRCNQWEQSVKDIHLCEAFLDAAPPRGFLARVIVHEIMHMWAADENAATLYSAETLFSAEEDQFWNG
jgi:hypothetical protein